MNANIKLTKTQQALINRVTVHGFGGVDYGGGRGAQGGRISFGTRELAALRKLVDLGMVRITNTVRDAVYNGGNCIHVSTYYYQLTDTAQRKVESGA